MNIKTRLKTRFILTILAIGCYLGFSVIYSTVEDPIKSVANVQQMKDTVEGYAVSKAAADNYIENFVMIGLMVTIGLIWVPIPFRKKSVVNYN